MTGHDQSGSAPGWYQFRIIIPRMFGQLNYSYGCKEEAEELKLKREKDLKGEKEKTRGVQKEN